MISSYLGMLETHGIVTAGRSGSDQAFSTRLLPLDCSAAISELCDIPAEPCHTCRCRCPCWQIRAAWECRFATTLRTLPQRQPRAPPRRPEYYSFLREYPRMAWPWLVA